ncbi:MAG: hypothetical protein P4L65_11425 [Legionella sp.]|nr:hypothetical protein [Legionella sp.]
MFDLIDLWKKTNNPTAAQVNSREYLATSKQAAINFDRDTTQSSFEFKRSPNVVFVKNIKTLQRADHYDELPEIKLTPQEEAIRLTVVAEQLAKNDKFYDGKQMIITSVIYDESSNTIYMEASQIPYSFIVALSSKKFPEDSQLYQRNFFKTGVLAPLVTSNGMTMIVQRAALGLYSVHGGFLEAKDAEKRLNFNDGRNLVTESASTELEEEIAGIKDTAQLSFNYSSPQITSISFRKTSTSPIGTVEFVAPSYAHCHSSYLKQVFLSRLAKDAKEHTMEHAFIPLYSKDRERLLNTLLTGPIRLPGASLYLPVALSLSCKLNPNTSVSLPRKIPNSSSVAWPMSIFSAKPERPLPRAAKADQIEVIEEEKALQFVS